MKRLIAVGLMFCCQIKASSLHPIPLIPRRGGIWREALGMVHNFYLMGEAKQRHLEGKG